MKLNNVTPLKRIKAIAILSISLLGLKSPNPMVVNDVKAK